MLALMHGGGALIIAFIFMVMVMTAIAQQEVLTRMQAEKLQLGYSSAFALVREIDERRAELPQLRRAERQLSSILSRQQSNLTQSEQRFELAWQSFLPLAGRAERSGNCPLSTGAEGPATRMAIWNEVQECAAGNALPSAVTRLVQRFTQSDRNVERAWQDLARAARDVARTGEELGAVRKRIELAGALTSDESGARRSFNEMNVLRESWMLGGGMLVAFPPPMLQILLAFVSGAFGALLVTLVLIVYPQARFDVSAGKETWARTLLGGLIAVCVYIVLLGGTAVLGASVGIAAAGTNYMAFCAIGILAGMFSDRVAFWLSDRANAFFKRPAPGEELHDGRTGTETRA